MSARLSTHTRKIRNSVPLSIPGLARVARRLWPSLPLFIECDFPKIFSYVILFHGAMFFLLFANFYRKTYTKKSKTGSAKKTDINGNGMVKTD